MPLLQHLFCLHSPPFPLKSGLRAGLGEFVGGSSSLQPQSLDEDEEGATWGVAEGVPEGESGHLGCHYVIQKGPLSSLGSFLLCHMRYDDACPAPSPLMMGRL